MTVTASSPTRPRPPAPFVAPGAAAGVHPPPFLLPGEHFVAAILWLALGAAGLILIAPQLAAGNIFDPRVFAVTHVFTLGVITTTIFGALYQLFPVTMGRAVRSVGLGHVTFWALQVGVVLVVCGLWHTHAGLQGAGWTAVTVAVALLGVNLISQWTGAEPDPLVGRYVAGGYAALVAALALGGLRIGESLGYGQIDRLAMISSHFHLAAAGFATSVAMGVGSRMLPMFLVSHGFPRWPLRWSGPLGALGLVLFTAGRFAGLPWLAGAGAVLLAAAVIIYLYLEVETFRRRVRRQLDPGLAHAAAAFVGLGAAVALGLVLLARDGFSPRLWAAYAVLALLGWLVLLIVGILYKILPFLTWLNLFGTRMGEANLPTVADLTRPLWGWLSLGCLLTALVVLVPAIGAGWSVAARAGAVIFALGVALVLAQAARVLRLWYRR